MQLHVCTSWAPPNQLVVPTDDVAALHTALNSGELAAHAWDGSHPTASAAAFDTAAHDSVPPPPDAATTKLEISRLHAIAATRTPEGDTAALYFEANGGWAMWQNEITAISGTDGPDKAREAWTAMREAVNRVSVINDALKAQYHRTRPFVTDPTLTVVGVRPDDGSYPSGHTVAAFAAALAIAGVVPSRRDEVINLACQTAWSRLYAGVHHLSDVLAAATLGARIATDVVQRQLAPGHAAVAA